MDKKEFKVDTYHISYKTGCVLEEPLAELPEYFEPWNRIAKNISHLIKERHVRKEVDKLPVLDHTRLEGHRQKRLAHFQLCLITSGYMWQDGDSGIVNILPKALAVPLYHVSKDLGVFPILSHMDLALANYSLTDPAGQYDDLSNIDCLYYPPGGEEGKWFVTVTIAVEFEFTKSLRSMEKVVNLVMEGETNKSELWQYYNMEDIVGHLNHICDCIVNMKKALSQMHDKLTAKTFFNVVRPFLGGWGGEGNALPEGVIFEGVSTEPFQLSGGSAAQSTTFQAIDAFLGVEHNDERRDFLLKMRKSMPPDHVKFIEDLEKKSLLASYVKEMNVPKLTAAYNKCITAVSDFRSYHISIVSKYIISAAKSTNEDNYKSLDATGTGGTDLIPFLKALLDNTKSKILTTGPAKGEGDRKTMVPTLFFGLAAAGLIAFGLLRKTITL